MLGALCQSTREMVPVGHTVRELEAEQCAHAGGLHFEDFRFLVE